MSGRHRQVVLVVAKIEWLKALRPGARCPGPLHTVTNRSSVAPWKLLQDVWDAVTVHVNPIHGRCWCCAAQLSGASHCAGSRNLRLVQDIYNVITVHVDLRHRHGVSKGGTRVPGPPDWTDALSCKRAAWPVCGGRGTYGEVNACRGHRRSSAHKSCVSHAIGGCAAHNWRK